MDGKISQANLRVVSQLNSRHKIYQFILISYTPLPLGDQFSNELTC